MDKYELTTGGGRTKVSLLSYNMGGDLVVCIYNENAHIGAVAVGEYDHKEERASISVVTRLGHKDDAVAQKAAYLICKSMKRPVCVTAGIHLDKITAEEIDEILENARALADEFIRLLQGKGGK